MTQVYFPFRGYSAWFSSSVHPSVVRKWDQFGGLLDSEDKAQLLFSDDAHAKDTVRVYSGQEVVVFLSSWVMEVLQHRSQALDVPLGRFCLHPHFTVQTPGDCYATPEQAPSTACLPRGQEPERTTETGCKARCLSSGLSSRRPDAGSGSREVESSCGGMDSQCVCPASDAAPDLLVESDALWQSAVGTMENTQLQDIPHVQGLQSPTLPLYDFLPRLAEFSMTRRKK